MYKSNVCFILYSEFKRVCSDMETNDKYKIYLASAAVAVGCAFVTYFVKNHKYRICNAVDAFNYLTIKTVNTKKTCDEVVGELRRRCGEHRALGFDCEWVTENGRRKPVALVQLSSPDGLCGLFRLADMKMLPKSLKELLEDETIYKVGVAAADDGKYLFIDYNVVLRSTLDVRHIAEQCGYEAAGLGSLSKTYLGVELDKSWRVRCSDWEAKELSARQKLYAAADAHVGVKIFHRLRTLYDRKRTLAWLFRTKDQCSSLDFQDVCRRYADVNYKNRVKQISPKTPKVNKDLVIIKKKYPNATRSKPLYHNCFLEAPDGELLCTCDNKKARWYVERELADVVTEEPLTVRLRFEPAGRSVGEVGRYYKLVKENKCVVCGGDNSYIRKNVVPREYRKYFPEIMKDHSSHDVVLLCGECHQLSNMRDQTVRDHLASLCDAPLVAQLNGKNKEDATCKKIRSAARALLYQSRKHVLPEDRRKELEDILLQYYLLHDEVTEELLQEAAEMQVVYDNENYESHGQKVVEYFLKCEGGLLRLEEDWREHFLNIMQPKYMPELWSVKHNEERLRVKWMEGRLTAENLTTIGVYWS